MTFCTYAIGLSNAKGLSASVAQINAVNELQPALLDNDDFLKLFNDGIKPSEEYHGFTNKENTGFDHIDQMM
jgi:hypothetical protein